MDYPVYTSDDLRIKLEDIRGKPVPLATLKSWRRRLGITPDANRLYTQDDLNILRGMLIHIARGGTIEQYRRLKIIEANYHGN